MDERWTKDQKEALRFAASNAKRTKRITAKDIANKAGVPDGSIREFLSSGKLGDENCDAVAKAMREMGLLPEEADFEHPLIVDIRDRIKFVTKLLGPEPPTRLALAQIGSVLEEGARMIGSFLSQSEGQANRASSE